MAEVKYWGMYVKEDKIYGIAYVPEGTPLFLLPDRGWVTDWQHIVLTLREGDFSDYLANQRAVPLCSHKLKGIMDGCKGEDDVLQWLPVTVRNEDCEEREYFVLHFPEEYDVLDKNKSIYYKGNNLIKPVISEKLAAGHDVFSFVDGYGIWRISDKVRRKMLKEKCAGVTFERTAVAE